MISEGCWGRERVLGAGSVLKVVSLMVMEGGIGKLGMLMEDIGETGLSLTMMDGMSGVMVICGMLKGVGMGSGLARLGGADSSVIRRCGVSFILSAGRGRA